MARVLQEVVTLLNRLIRTEYDAVETRRAAVAQVGDAVDRHELGLMLADHRGHVDDLALVVRNLGGEPLSHGDLRQLLDRRDRRDKPLVVRAPVSGILEALRGQEEGTRDAYAEATSLPGVPIDVLAVLERLLADEHRHISWLVGRLASTSPPRPTRPRG
jgi:bacterioferritin (cytochrome b1)